MAANPMSQYAKVELKLTIYVSKGNECLIPSGPLDLEGHAAITLAIREALSKLVTSR